MGIILFYCVSHVYDQIAKRCRNNRIMSNQSEAQAPNRQYSIQEFEVQLKKGGEYSKEFCKEFIKKILQIIAFCIYASTAAQMTSKIKIDLGWFLKTFIYGLHICALANLYIQLVKKRKQIVQKINVLDITLNQLHLLYKKLKTIQCQQIARKFYQLIKRFRIFNQSLCALSLILTGIFIWNYSNGKHFYINQLFQASTLIEAPEVQTQIDEKNSELQQLVFIMNIINMLIVFALIFSLNFHIYLYEGKRQSEFQQINQILVISHKRAQCDNKVESSQTSNQPSLNQGSSKNGLNAQGTIQRGSPTELLEGY